MKVFREILLLGLLAAPLAATSVAPVDHECPVCAKPSVGMELMSYSNFGDPERDLSDQMMFSGPGAEICPHDLFATWPGRRVLDANEKADLANFLKQPVVILTPGERQALDGDLGKIRGSVWWEMLWARTCDSQRKPDPRRVWQTAMQLHYAGRFAKEPWETRLATHFAGEAIRNLKEAEASEWPKDEEKRIFSYLRAELLRRSGKLAEAKALFAEVIQREAAFEADEDSGWIGRWAAEQSRRIDAVDATAQVLGGWLLDPIPDPWRDDGTEEKKGWAAHRVAIEVLSERAGRGDKASSDVLWSAIGRKPRHLLAIAETTEGLSKLRGTDPRWAAWFDELEADLKARRLLDFGREESNEERVRNVLGRAVEGEHLGEKRQLEKISAAVDRAIAGGGVPDAGIGREALLEELKARLEVPDRRVTAGKMMIQVLKSAGESADDFAYPVRSAFVKLAGIRGLEAEWAKELGGEWKSGFWKLACEYLAGKSSTGEPLSKHPLARKVFEESDGKVGEELLWRLFAGRKDLIWKTKALAALEKEPWLKDEVSAYALATGDEALREALFRRISRLRSGDLKSADKRMALYEIHFVEDLIRSEKLARLSLR